jgi:mannonate dehydratase
MKVGLGIPGPLLTEQSLSFARQVGATHVVAHIVGGRAGTPIEELLALPGLATFANDERYTYEGLLELKSQVRSAGLELFSIENFEPADWFDVLLDGPRRDEQMERVKDVVRNVGRAEISTMGYNFSIAGVWGRPLAPSARGEAMSATFADTPQTPIPKGMVWNAVYEQELYDRSVRDGDYLEPISSDQLWERYTRFLQEIVPVAEEAGVVMALHPDDPPLVELRGTPRLIHRAALYDQMLGLVDSSSNAMEFCVGTLSEMPDQDIYEVVEHFVATGRIQYVHLRNVQGRVPNYHETFIDEGYVDMQRILRILKDGGFDGVVIPDHTPWPACTAPWHAGMAYALGWIRASLRAINALDE